MTIIPNQPMPKDTAEVDFEVLVEDWTRYTLKNGTKLRIRVPVYKLYQTKEATISGYHNFGVSYTEVIVSALDVSDHGEPSTDMTIKAEDVVGEVDVVARYEEKWQEYKTKGLIPYIIRVRPVLTKVLKTNKYNAYGEVIYQVFTQNIIDIKKV